MTVKKNLQAAKAAEAEALLAEKQLKLARQALEMRKAGKTYWEIAEKLHLAEYAVARLVAEQIRAAAALVNSESKRELLNLELSRLDKLQDAIWDQAIAGDIKAVEGVLKVIVTRARVLGLDNDPNAGTKVRAVIVPTSSSEYEQALRAIASGEIGA